MKTILKNDKGLALIVAIMVMVILLSITGAGLVFSGLNLKTASSHKARTQTFYIADAGLHFGWQETDNGDGVNDFATVFSSGATTQVPPFSVTSFGGGSYNVTALVVPGSNPGLIKFTSTGCIPSGCPSGSSKAVIEAYLIQEQGKAPKAVVTNGELKISGDPKIMGARGGAHSNDDMRIASSPGVQMPDGLTASNMLAGGGSLPEGMVIVDGNPCIGSLACFLPPSQQPDEYTLNTKEKRKAYAATHSEAPRVTIPKINPADYAPLVAALGGLEPAYILHDDGTVTTGGSCGTNGLCTGGTPVTVPMGWEFQASTWRVPGNSAADGIFYAETAVKVTNKPGTSSSPWQATIIARDSISFTGDPSIKPYPTNALELQNIQLVTGNDLDINGHPAASGYQGAILVHQQFKISGDPTINGFIIAGDGQPTWPGDPFPSSTGSSSIVTMNEISGHPTITYNGDFSCLGPGCPAPVKMVAWRQIF